MLCVSFISSVILQSCRIIGLKLTGFKDATLVVNILIDLLLTSHNVCACMIFRNHGLSTVTYTVLIH